MVARSERLPSLDGLRAVAILLVVIGHGVSSMPAPPSSVTFAAQFVGNGHLGVCLFFSLSGYLITHLLLRERERNGAISLTSFYLRRLLRIFPAAYAYVATVALLAFAGVIDVRWPELVVAAFYVWNYSLSRSGWFLAHFWSLCLEEQFYLLWPTFLVFAGRFRAVTGARVVIVLMPIVRIVSYFVWPAGRGLTMIMAPTTLDAMMYGCLAALLQDDRGFQSVLAKLFRWRAPVVAAVFIFVASPILQARFRGLYYLPIGASLDCAGCTLLMLWALHHPQSVLGRWLNARPMVHLGTISYSLYIWQQLFLAPPRFRLTWVGVFPLNEICALATAEFSYWVIERPFLGLKSRVADRVRRPEIGGRRPVPASVILPGRYPGIATPEESPGDVRP